jgi:hypothetical protein
VQAGAAGCAGEPYQPPGAYAFLVKTLAVKDVLLIMIIIVTLITI